MGRVQQVTKGVTPALRMLAIVSPQATLSAAIMGFWPDQWPFALATGCAAALSAVIAYRLLQPSEPSQQAILPEVPRALVPAVVSPVVVDEKSKVEVQASALRLVDDLRDQIAALSKSQLRAAEDRKTLVTLVQSARSKGQALRDSLRQTNLSLQSSHGDIVAMRQAVRQISDVIDAIRMVVEQTNLLALNATIEAARAGESGRGFAAVATEVRSMAHETGRAMQQLSAIVDRLQDAATNGAARSSEVTSALDATLAAIAQGLATLEIPATDYKQTEIVDLAALTALLTEAEAKFTPAAASREAIG